MPLPFWCGVTIILFTAVDSASGANHEAHLMPFQHVREVVVVRDEVQKVFLDDHRVGVR